MSVVLPPEEPLRVLLLAEAANPEWASVPLVGWSHAAAIAQLTKAHVVTQIRNARAFVRAGWREGREFTAIDSESVVRPLHRLSERLRGGGGRGWTTSTAIYSLGYPYFEKLVARRFRERLRAGEFDVVHRITPVSPTSPSPMAVTCRRLGVPFVLGPINGGLPWPREFREARWREREWLSYVRGAYRLLPGYRSTLAAASAVLVGSCATLSQLPNALARKCIYLPENAIDPDRFPTAASRTPASQLRIVFVGRLVAYKGADMLLEACLPLLRSGACQLTIVGDGPERSRLETIARDGCVDANVEFVGWVDQQRVHAYLAESDLMAFPSIREFGGGVVLEAMACGAVPVVVDYGGPAELVTPDTGFLVELGSREHIVKQFGEVLRGVVARPASLEPLRLAGVERSRSLFTWAAKASQVREVYRWLLGRRCEKPDFGMPLRASLMQQGRA